MLLQGKLDLEICQLKSAEQLEALGEQWGSLWQRLEEMTPFQSPQWLVPWWKHIGQGELCSLAFRLKGRLVGLAPLYVYTIPENGTRQLLLVGSGNSDYLDVLLEPEVAGQALRKLDEFLDRSAPPWDFCDFQQLRPNSRLLKSAHSQWSEKTLAQEVCPVLDLPQSAEELSSKVPRHMLHNLHYYAKRVEKLMGEPVRVERAQDPGSLEEFLEALFRLHRARWQSQGGDGVLADPAIQAFHREAARGLLQAGVLRMYAMRLRGEISAVYYGFLHAGQAYYYLGGFDPALDHLSLGTLVIGHAVKEAVREGARDFDFLRGREDYKYKWGAKDRNTFARQLWRKAPGTSKRPFL